MSYEDCIDVVQEWVLAQGFIKLADVELYLQGMIVMWSGTEANIPDGWHICDGTNGTPNLRNRFVRGSYFLSPPGDAGGEVSHTHDFTTDGHFHSHPVGEHHSNMGPRNLFTDTKVDTGTTDPKSHVPRYWSLAFIMKL